MQFGRKVFYNSSMMGRKQHRGCLVPPEGSTTVVWVLSFFTLTGDGRFAVGVLQMCCYLLRNRREDLEGKQRVHVTVIAESWRLGPRLPSLSPSHFSEKIYICLSILSHISLHQSFTISDQEASLDDSSSIMRSKVNRLQNLQQDCSL